MLKPGVFCVVPSKLLKLCNVFLKLSNDVGFGSYVVPDSSLQQFLTLINCQLKLRTIFDLKLVKFNAERNLTHSLVKDGLELLIREQSIVCYVQSLALGVQNFKLFIHLLQRFNRRFKLLFVQRILLTQSQVVLLLDLHDELRNLIGDLEARARSSSSSK